MHRDIHGLLISTASAQAAAAFDRPEQPEMAERHRAANRRQTEVTEANGDEAARWP